ncbi:MAG: flagellar basal body rod protein FlgB [Candidatus Cohnella colombiensis]|uniref:Flagellar basal body rod protein FlgB n=1 Tax=Candidatus Cohnella colombiensis TaxID=3121368 RepID=A0AA95JDC8_9BACL|nr:MAG: flagellar basal body rod protein FlgB [Cohnella sp.]
MDLLGGASFQRLEGALTAASARQRVYANNIANGDTPNFKRSDVAFEDILSSAIGSNGSSLRLKTTNARHIPMGGAATPTPKVVTDESTIINNNGNNVDIDREMALLAENQLRYNLFIQQINHNVKMIRIGTEGRS